MEKIIEIIKESRERGMSDDEILYSVLENVFGVKEITIKCDLCGEETEIIHVHYVKLEPDDEEGKLLCIGCFLDAIVKYKLCKIALVHPPFSVSHNSLGFIEFMRRAKGLRFHSDRFSDGEIKREIAKILLIMRLL